MNLSMIGLILSYVLQLEGGLLVICALIGLIYGESQGVAFIVVAVFALGGGFLLQMKKPRSTVIYLKEGCIATALAWILMSLVGCLPFIINGDIPGFTDALYETVSGLTTTGSTILTNVEALSHCSLFWRSLTHYIGGMGVLVFLLAVLPLSGGSNINLMRAESPGPSVGKLVPKMKSTARILYIIYTGLVFLEFVLLLFGGVGWFDALNTALATGGTGGFGIHNDSIGGYSAYGQWVIGVFMMLFGVNFNFYYFLILGRVSKAFKIEEVRAYVLLILAATLVFFVDTVHHMSGGEALRTSFFQVTALVSSTGFSTADFNQWSETSKCVVVLLMTVGACAGSTGGGIKVSRVMIAVKSLWRELKSYVHPKVIKPVKFEDKAVEDDLIRSILIYFVAFIGIFIVSCLLLSLEGNDFVTNFTAVLSNINNIGPGLSKVGPAENFTFFTPFSKYVLMFDMLAGRLELFPMLMLFYPGLWQDVHRQLRTKRRWKRVE